MNFGYKRSFNAHGISGEILNWINAWLTGREKELY